MKTVKTITCHDVCNHGASLQAYALIRFLQGSGYNVQIIDYKPDYLRHEASFWNVPNPAWNRSFMRRMIYRIVKFNRNRIFSSRRKTFDVFNRRYFSLTKTTYFSLEELRKNPPEADIYVCGSDQIWNPLFPNGRDGAFYLDFAPIDKKRFSYAASFATESLPNEWQSFIAEQVKNLDAVSVREKSGVKILADLGIKAETVLDPVFLLSPEEWGTIADKSRFPFQKGLPYLLFYGFEGDDAAAEFAKSLAKKQNISLYSVNENRLADRSFYQYGPETFLALIKNAEMVVTSSFHATAFSVLFQKLFWVMRRAEKINTRMADFLTGLELQYRLITPQTEINIQEPSQIDWD